MACESNCNCSNCASSFLFPVGLKGDTGSAGAPSISASGNPNTNNVIGAANGQVYTDASTGLQYSWNASTGVWDPILDSGGNQTDLTGNDGDDGQNAFLYIAYATDAAGTGFVLNVPASNSTFIAVLSTSVKITTPVVSDFTGLFIQFVGDSANAGFPVGFIGFYVGDTRALGDGSPASKGSLADNLSGSLGIKDLAGWALCNGDVHSGFETPDWTDKFVMSTVEPNFGAADSVTTTGGQDNVTLTADNLAGHTHPATSSLTASSAGAQALDLRIFPGLGFTIGGTVHGFHPDASGTGTSGMVDSVIAHTHPVTGTVTVSANSTTNASFDNRPAFIRAAAIVKLPSA